MLKPDRAQTRLRRLAAAIIMAAPPERVLLKRNQFARQTRSAPSHAPGPAAARLSFAQICQARFMFRVLAYRLQADRLVRFMRPLGRTTDAPPRPRKTSTR
jgi:hypothetical protein